MKGGTKWRGREPMKPSLIRNSWADLFTCRRCECTQEWDRLQRALNKLRSLRPRGGLPEGCLLLTALVTSWRVRRLPTWNSIIHQVLTSDFGTSHLRSLLCIRAGDAVDKSPFNGSTGATRRGHPGLSLRRDTLIDSLTRVLTRMPLTTRQPKDDQVDMTSCALVCRVH